MSESSVLPPGAVLGAFVVGKVLGEGASAIVYEGWHEASKLRTAIKVMRGGSELDREKLRAEARAVAGLDHPHIVRVYDYGDEAGRLPWLVMERAGLGSLRGQRAPSFRALARWMVALLDALGHAHARGVLHLDLNPANVLRAAPTDRRPGLKLADFGVSAARGSRAQTAGTIPFMAPEQFDPDAALGRWTDLYGLGCLCWSLCTGEPPHVAEHVPALVWAKMHGALPTLRPEFAVPAGFERWLSGLLAPAPKDRWVCAADAAAALVELRPREGWRLPLTADWRPASTAVRGPVFERGGLRLAALRRPPILARDTLRDRLWAVLIEVATGGQPAGVVLRGPRGLGTSALALWFLERAEECGLALGRRAEGPAPGEGEGQAPSFGAWIRTLLGDRQAALLWIDDASRHPAWLDAADRLVRLRDHPLLTVLTTSAEPGRAPAIDAFLRRPRVRVFDLDPLPDSAVRQLLEDHLGFRGPFVDEAVATAHGNPKAALDRVQQWVEGDQLIPFSGGYRFRGGVAPPPIRDPTARLPVFVTAGHLPVIAAAAALGGPLTRASWRGLCAAAGLPPPESLPHALWDGAWLVEAGELLRFGDEDFREHVLTTLQEGQPALTKRIYAVAARLGEEAGLEPRRLAALHLAAGDPGAAIPHFRDAVTTRIDRSDHRGAGRLLVGWRQAVESTSAPPALEAPLLVQEAFVFRALTRFQDARTAADRAAALAEELHWPALRWAATLEAGRCALNVGQHDEALRLLSQAWEGARAVSDLTTAGAAARMLGLTTSYRGDTEAARHTVRWAFDAFDRLGEQLRAAWAAITASQIDKQAGDLGATERWLRVAEARAAGPGGEAVRAEVHNGLGEVSRLLGRDEEAVDQYREALRWMVETGSTDRAVVEANLGLVLLRRGAFIDARTTLLPAREDFTLQQRADLVSLVDLGLAWGAAGLQQWEEWDERCRLALDALARTGFRYFDVADVAERAALLALSHGQPARAVALFDLAIQQFDSLHRPADADRVRRARVARL